MRSFLLFQFLHYEDCSRHIELAAKGGGYWLAFGCEIPRELPYENMRAPKIAGKNPINET